MLVPTTAAIVGLAGALVVAMAYAAVRMDLGALQRAAGTLMDGLLRVGLGLGLAAGALGGVVAGLFRRKDAFPVAVALAFVVSCGGALYAVGAAAAVAGAGAAVVGGVLGAALGALLGWFVAHDTRTGGPARPRPGPEADVDPWLADACEAPDEGD